jgi:coiled-coil domain-containing protein 77
VKQGMLHKIEWEIKTRQEEISELQRQVKMREDVMMQGRNDLMRLARENEELVTSQQEDRDKLARLMNKTEAIHQDIFINEGEKPNTVYSYGTQNSCKNMRPKHIVRTIHMPSAQNQEISEQKEELLKALHEQRQGYFDLINQVREEGRKIDFKVRTEYEENQKTINQLVSRLKKAQSGKLAAVKDYFLIRHEYELHFNNLIKERQILQEKIDSILKEIVESKKDKQKNLKSIQKNANIRATDFSHEFRKQADQAKDNYEQINEQYNHLKQVFFDKVRDLEDKYSQIFKRVADLKVRKHLEAESLKTLKKNLEDKIDLLENPPRKFEKSGSLGKKNCERCVERGTIH